MATPKSAANELDAIIKNYLNGPGSKNDIVEVPYTLLYELRGMIEQWPNAPKIPQWDQIEIEKALIRVYQAMQKDKADIERRFEHRFDQIREQVANLITSKPSDHITSPIDFDPYAKDNEATLDGSDPPQ